ncbi:MAG TPA: alpha/beta hydrolase [Acidimicrobiia bacterium]|jgi:pimeloyl-ACP methyl ester carboxylesterase|nr:alpha/beta hydrolase [Acidimicrobiia bacterium]
MRFIDVSGKTLHYRRVGVDFRGVPLVFLHEGLGSVELWRDFPVEVASRAYRPGLVYSRHGNGWSSPLTEPRRPDYMHEEALHVLPRVVDELVGRPPVLVGHSDGASIALIYAGSGHAVEALVLIAPHVFVEPLTVQSIAAIRGGFEESELPEKMARYHTEPSTTFYGWADIWLSPAFASWDITEYLTGVSCPTLLIQGDRDEYGTMAQLDAIESQIKGPAERLIVPDAAHSPHLSDPDLVVGATARFVEVST